MYWFYEKGEKLMDRIEYEEWALKAVREGEGVKVAKDGKVLERIEVSAVVAPCHFTRRPVAEKMGFFFPFWHVLDTVGAA